MSVAGLLDGASAYAWAAARWQGLLDTRTLIVVGVVVLAAAGLAVNAMRRRRGRHRRKAARPAGGIGLLKERLHLRLAEPSELFADAVVGPTVGAGETLEADIAEAAKTVLPEAG